MKIFKKEDKNNDWFFDSSDINTQFGMTPPQQPFPQQQFNQPPQQYQQPTMVQPNMGFSQNQWGQPVYPPNQQFYQNPPYNQPNQEEIMKIMKNFEKINGKIEQLEETLKSIKYNKNDPNTLYVRFNFDDMLKFWFAQFVIRILFILFIFIFLGSVIGGILRGIFHMSDLWLFFVK